jgi:PIN domain nuclease of toxin-antitoxin system
MAYLLDTHVFLWVATDSDRLSALARVLISAAPEVYFSTANLWEVVIKRARPQSDFAFDASLLRASALRAGYKELPIRSAHVLAVADLPPLHSDPFDRVLLAQAVVEQMQLLTVDNVVLSYGAPALRAP